MKKANTKTDFTDDKIKFQDRKLILDSQLVGIIQSS